MKNRWFVFVLIFVVLCLSGCGLLFPNDAKNHNYSPGWDSDEYNHWHRCIDAGYGDLRKDEEPHNFVIVQIIEPSYDHMGFTVKRCTVCGKEYETDYIAMLNHHFSSKYEYNQFFHYYPCTDPDCDERKDEEPHSFVETVVEADYEHDGYTLHECSVCGYSYATDQTAKLKYVIKWANEDGTILDTNYYYKDSLPEYTGTIPEKVNKEDGFVYTFSGWDKEIEEVTEDTTYTATYNVKKARLFVTYLDYNDEVLHKATSDDIYEALHYLSDEQYRNDDNEFSYTFDKWQEVSNENGVLVFKATYYKIPLGLTIEEGVVKSYSGNAQSIVIPDRYNGYDVTKIDERAFLDVTSLKSIILPETLIEIERCAFENCTSLESIFVPDNTKAIWFSSFKNCISLKTINLPKLVKISDLLYLRSQEDYENLSLERVIIRNASDDDLLGNSFRDCSTIKYIDIQGDLSEVSYGYFYGCTSLEEITLPDSIQEIKEYAFYGCSSLKSINLPNSLTTINEYAFSGCASLENIIIPDSVKRLDENIFNGCSSLRTIKMPSNMTEIESNAFAGCSNELFNIYDNGLYLADGELRYAYLIRAISSDITSLVVNDNCKLIAKSALNLCRSIETLTIPFVGRSSNSTDKISYIFHDPRYGGTPSSLTTIILSNKCTEIPDNAFSNNSSIRNITIPNTVTKIGKDAFKSLTLNGYSYGNGSYIGNDDNHYMVFIRPNSSATSITINDNCKFISDVTFEYNTSVKTIIFGMLSYEVKGYEFSQLVSLTTITVSNNNPIYTVKNNMLLNKDETILYMAPKDTTGSITIPNTVKVIKNSAFYYSKYTSISIPESVEEIEAFAFKFSKLKNLTIPSKVKTFGEEVFTHVGLESITASSNALGILYSLVYSEEVVENAFFVKVWPTTLKTINIVGLKEDTSFNVPYTNYVETINIGENVDVIPDRLFSSFNSLKTINVDENNTNYITIDGILYDIDQTTLICVPSLYEGTLTIKPTVTKLAPYSLYYYKGSKSITLNDNITEIGDYSFTRTSFETIVLPDNLLSIGKGAFSGSSITSMTIPSTVQTVGEDAFYSCYSLESLVLPFVGESLTENRTLMYIFENCNYAGSLKRLELSDSCTSLAEDAFKHNNTLETIVFGKNIEDIPLSLFDDIQSLKMIEVSELNRKYSSKDGLLYNKDHTKLLFCPYKIEGEVKVENGVTELSDKAFYERSLITKLTLPNSLKTIGKDVFTSCDSLTYNELDDVYYIGSEANPYLVLIKAKEGITISIISENCKYIVPSAFKDRINLTRVTLNDYIALIEKDTFDGCTSLKNIEIPSSVTYIGENAFRNCSTLTSIVIPDSVTYIGNSAFKGCNSLESITIPFIGESEEETDNSYFGYIFGNKRNRSYSDENYIPSSLTTLFLGEKIKNINSYVFGDCSFERIYLGSEIEYIDIYAFSGLSSIIYNEYEGGKYLGCKNNPYFYLAKCDSTTIANIHEKCNLINLSSFGYDMREINVPSENTKYASVDGVLYTKDMTTLLRCPPLKGGALNIPEGVEIISSTAFYYNYNLTAISIPSTLKEIHSSLDAGYNHYYKIVVASENKYYVVDDDVLYNKDETKIIYCGANKKYFELPETVTHISGFAFGGMPVGKTIVLNNNIIDIGDDFESQLTRYTTLVLSLKEDETINPYLMEVFNNLVNAYLGGYIIELENTIVLQL